MTQHFLISRDHFSVQAQWRLQAVELIMAVWGRNQDSPREVRDQLLSMTDEELQQVYKDRVESL